MLVTDQAANLVLDMLADTINAINAGESGDRVIVEGLSNALGATAGVSVYADQDQSLELVAGVPDAVSAAALFDEVTAFATAGLSHHVTIDHITGLGHVVYVVIPPDDSVAPDGGFARILAFTRKAPYDGASAQLLERACRPLQALWPLAARMYVRRRATTSAYALTSRELEVLGLLSHGLLATSIASRLDLSPRTVHKHLGNIYRKLGVHDRLVAVSIARASGLLGPS